MKHRERWIPVTLGLGTLALATGIWFAWPVARHAFDSGRQFRPLYIPSQSMRPTLEVGDRFYPRDLGPKGPARGEVIVYRLGEEKRVGRVVGLAGDSVALAGGIVSINGKPVPQKQIGMGTADELGSPARKLLEQFPGEAQPHAILDQHATRQDDFAAVVVPAGHLFVMGDNRDNSSDSRFPPESFGVGMLPESDVLGRVDFIAWSMALPGRFDRPITRIDK
ncbi:MULTISPECIES: signal peptidase I [unclassified Sphingomonas]|uniref:signal peptidase I n=1 Tax=Sphingomonas TaxID=13687 RepID=UPI00095C6894|nr:MULTISPECIES: signal peptidase I [unclassified Sphingomonas]MBN8810894.1 signal peptidase I [Sphingomonas sp.]OJY49228.1 MAG: signal peptidase I [Sphingomonas sp. 67-41]